MGQGDKVSTTRDMEERTGDAGPHGREGQEEVGSGSQQAWEKQETRRIRVAPSPRSPLPPLAH